MSEPTMTDDHLDTLLRASSPYPPTLDRGLSLRAQADLERILRGRRKARTVRKTRTWVWGISVPAVAVAAVALVLALVVNPFTAPGPAAAQGLPPLTYEPSALNRDEAIDLAQSLLAGSPGVAAPIREAVTVAWYAQVAMDGPDRGTVISPEVMTWTWDPVAKTSRLLVTAGEPYRADGTPIPTRDDIPAPGSVVRDDQMGETALTAPGPDGAAAASPRDGRRQRRRVLPGSDPHVHRRRTDGVRPADRHPAISHDVDAHQRAARESAGAAARTGRRRVPRHYPGSCRS